MNSEDLEQLLRNRFCPPAWAFIPQVRNGTGYLKTTRTADAIAMGLWPSRGLYLNGFEIKVNRSDWLSELKNPAKADEIAQFCDFWWVMASKDIVKVEEMPPPWGLMIPFGSTSKIIKQAKLLKSVNPDKLFLAAILRRAQEIITPENKLKKEFEEGRKRGNEEAQENFKWEREQHQKLKEIVGNFEKKVGISLDGWNRDIIADAVKMVLDGKHLTLKNQLNNLLTTAKQITKGIEEELSIIIKE